MKMLQDGVDVYCLPDNAYCAADDGREVRLTLMIVLTVVKYVREIVIIIMRIGDL